MHFQTWLPRLAGLIRDAMAIGAAFSLVFSTLAMVLWLAFADPLIARLRSATARMRGRLVLNGATEIRGSLGEISATHVSLATAIWLQTMVPLTAGDTVELQGYVRVADGYFAADHTSFWGCKIG